MQSFLICLSYLVLFTAVKTTPLPDNHDDYVSERLLRTSIINNTYDYVIVGAGTAGLALASRLSEDGKSTVAVIEAGQDINTQFLNLEFSQTPGGDVIGCGADDSDSAQDAIDWGFRTIPQKGAANRVIRYARGKCSGGSSTRNFMIYQRPSLGSMGKWKDLTGDDSWGFMERLDDFKKSITFTPPNHAKRQESPQAQYSEDDFGSSSPDAPLQVSYPNLPQNFSKFMQLSANELGVQSKDSFNGGSLLGVQYCSTTIDPTNGHRSTSRYFYEKTQNRPSKFKLVLASKTNICYYKDLKANFGTLAKQIVFTHDEKRVPRASGVAVSTDSKGAGTTGVIYAAKEVILSAGAFHSPQLLMVSGIGPQDQLAKFNITPLVVNDKVGQEMQDHIFFGPSYKVTPDTHTFTDLSTNPFYLTAQLLNFTINALGPLTSNVADLLAWEKIPGDTLLEMGATQLSTYPTDWPHLEALSAPGLVGNFSNLFQQNAAAGSDGSRFVTILMALVAPQSRGTVTLSSADTKDLPIIDPAWLTHPIDQKAAIYAFKRARQYFATNAMRPILANVTEYFPGPDVKTDEEILDFVRENLMTVWHASSTCSMKKKELGGVLDSRLRVYGLCDSEILQA